jgi:hypothetical protein
MTTIGIIFLLVSVGYILLEIKNKFLEQKDRELLETVTKSHRGTKSERKLVLMLLKAGVPAQTIFHDLYLNNRIGNYTQIDLVLATKAGIIVFEVKDYSGWIFGTGNHNKWTQVLAYGKQKYYFYNPILQNRKHIEELKDKLPRFQNIPFYSIVVFFGDCTFKDVSYIPKDTFLVKSHKAITAVNEIVNNNKPVEYNNKREIHNVLSAAVINGDDKEKVEKHIKNISNLLGKHRILD